MVRGRASGGWWEPSRLRAPQGSRVLSEPRPHQPSVCELQGRKRDLHRDSPAWWRQAVPGALGGACAWEGVWQRRGAGGGSRLWFLSWADDLILQLACWRANEVKKIHGK